MEFAKLARKRRIADIIEEWFGGRGWNSQAVVCFGGHTLFITVLNSVSHCTGSPSGANHLGSCKSISVVCGPKGFRSARQRLAFISKRRFRFDP
jgi:hypothetical protein